MKEAEANREADEKRKEEADTRNDAEQMIFQTEKAIKDLGDKVEESDKKDAEDKITALKEAMEKSDIEDIKKKKEELQEVTYKLAAKVYEQANAQNQANQNAEQNTETKDDTVKEADFEEK